MPYNYTVYTHEYNIHPRPLPRDPQERTRRGGGVSTVIAEHILLRGAAQLSEQLAGIQEGSRARTLSLSSSELARL
jgi:hypothetical protein